MIGLGISIMDNARTSFSVVFRIGDRGTLKKVHYSLPRISFGTKFNDPVWMIDAWMYPELME